MSRDDGFAIADVSTGMLDDPKVKALWRELGPDEGRMSHAIALYTATLLASWHHGARVTVEEAAPVWLTVDADLVGALVHVHLLDRTRRLKVSSWKHWFDPVASRRDAARERWRRANEKRNKVPTRLPRGANGGTATDRSVRTGPSGPSGPDRTSPSLPTGPSPTRAPAREATPSKDGERYAADVAELVLARQGMKS